MANYINDTLLSSEPMKKQREQAKSLERKWKKTGLLEGIEDDFERAGMAQLLENQARQLISEASYTSPNTGTMGTGYKGDEEWSGVALPLVRRVFGEIAAKDFVSVQPMNLPSGLVFYLDFKYGSAVSGRATTESLAGKTGPFSPSGSNAPYGEDGLYGVGQYGYSISGSGIALTFSAAATASLTDIHYDMEVSGAVASGHEIYVIS